MIDVQNLTKVYDLGRGRTVQALDGVDLHVPQGQVFGILGRSGAGKSTLLRCVNLLERPTSGSVRVDGQDMTALRGAALRRARRGIGMIHQHFALLSSRTVAGNVAFPLEVMGTPRAQRARRVAELLDVVGLGDRGGSYPAQLSGGQKQRVGIARALAAGPKVLLSDEATSALDPETTGSILDLLRRLNRELGLTVLLITHEMGVIKRVCDSAAVMHDGRFLESGPLPELLAAPDSRLADALFPLPTVDLPGVVTLSYAERATEPVLSALTREFDVDVNILAGTVETVAGAPYGRLKVQLTGERTAEALEYLRARGLAVRTAGDPLAADGAEPTGEGA
ncbi:methionine ABC transporter ATP-binding protein [Allonocardiopsis opalescens]|uniref:methionine ABC transporter ATP-binding protein n=1 Tax=Allonocardiopsis opalescens TaxID=1144618 RepID=UPI000D057280|nr:ATP-binding cassette domain-containing protein [Allonocardiopsis opalescens]